MELIVPDDKLSLAIGKKGQNVRLASQLTGWRIDIHSESKVREMEARARQSMAAIKSGRDDGGGLPTATIEALFQAGFRSAARGRRGEGRRAGGDSGRRQHGRRAGADRGGGAGRGDRARAVSSKWKRRRAWRARRRRWRRPKPPRQRRPRQRATEVRHG